MKRSGTIVTTSVKLQAATNNATALSQNVRLERIEIAKYVTIGAGAVRRVGALSI